MNKDKIEGKAKGAMGSARERLGHITHNSDMEAKGAEQKAEGQAQEAGGKVKAKVKEIKDKIPGQ